MKWKRRFLNEFKEKVLKDEPNIAKVFDRVLDVLMYIDKKVMNYCGNHLSYHLAINLFYHILETLNIPVKGIDFKGEIFKGVNKKYPIAYTIAKTASEYIQEKFGINMNERESTHMAVLLAEATDELSQTFYKFRYK